MSHRILIVEDQADIRKLIRMALEFGDFDIHEAVDGESGLAAAMNLKPALVLLDVSMPGQLDGYQVCQRIKQDPALTTTQVVLMTARGQVSDTEAGQRAGVNAYLVKPFSPLELIDRVETLVAAT